MSVRNEKPSRVVNHMTLTLFLFSHKSHEIKFRDIQMNFFAILLFVWFSLTNVYIYIYRRKKADGVFRHYYKYNTFFFAQDCTFDLYFFSWNLSLELKIIFQLKAAQSQSIGFIRILKLLFAASWAFIIAFSLLTQ